MPFVYLYLTCIACETIAQVHFHYIDGGVLSPLSLWWCPITIISMVLSYHHYLNGDGLLPLSLW